MAGRLTLSQKRWHKAKVSYTSKQGDMDMRKVKKVPLRTCVVTKEVLPKKELIRVAATKEGEVSVDLKGKAPGRGAYLKLSKDVILLAKKNKALDRKLEVSVPDAIYDELLTLTDD